MLRQVEFTKIVPEAKVPSKIHSNDAGYDLFALFTTDLIPGELTEVLTGIVVACPDDLYFITWAKSSFNRENVFTKSGVFDPGYRGSISVFMRNDGPELITIYKHQKFAQILFFPVVSVDFKLVKELPSSERGAGKFGSTGKF